MEMDQALNISHRAMWASIDALAAKAGGRTVLARKAGLSDVSLSSSHRVSRNAGKPNGRNTPRWPDMSTLAKLGDAAGVTAAQFGRIYETERLRLMAPASAA